MSVLWNKFYSKFKSIKVYKDSVTKYKQLYLFNFNSSSKESIASIIKSLVIR